MTAPPRLARWLLSWRLRVEDRDDVLLNLDELHRHHVEHRGKWFAGWWYWRDALVLAVRFGRPREARDPGSSGFGWMLVGAGKAFARAPRHALMATATLGLGVAVTTLVFALVWAAVLRPLRFPSADRLDWVWASGSVSVTQRQFASLREAVAGTSELTAFAGRSFALTGLDEPAELNGFAVSANHFRVFGLPPYLGRALRDEDGVPGAEPVVLLGYNFWRDRFGADSGVVGRRFDLYTAAAIPMIAGAFTGQPHTVIGVLPPRYSPFGSRPDVLTPLVADPTDAAYTNLGELWMVGRRRAGAVPADVEASIRGAVLRTAELDDLRDATLNDAVVPLHDALVGGLRPTMFAALAAAALILAISCANVVSLLLVRLRQRDRELAIRRALGANRHQLVTQLLAEGTVLAGAAGAVGIGLALGLQRAMAAALPDQLAPVELTVVGVPLAVAVGVMALATLVCGLLPSIGLRHGSGSAALAGRPGVGDTRQGARLTRGLVVGEIALALVVTYAALAVGLSLSRLTRVDLGFDPANVLTMRLAPADRRYREPEVRRALIDAVLERARAIPGVTAAGAIHFLPIADGGPSIRFRNGPPDGMDPLVASYRVITPGYLETMGVSVRAGRGISRADVGGGEPVGLVNEALARQLWPGESALGRELYRVDGQRFFTVVGVVGDVRQRALAALPDPEIYLPLTQTGWASAMTVVVRSGGRPPGLESAIRGIARSLDADLPITRVAAMTDVVRDSAERDRTLTLVFSLFAVLALGLGAIGVFAVAGAAVAGRQREIGVRLAVGATPRDIARGELARSGTVASFGIALGLVGTLGAARFMGGLLYDVAPLEPSVLVAVSGLLLAVVALAVAVPTWRATQVDPSRTLGRDG